MEDHDAAVYRTWADRFPDEEDTFSSLAKECERVQTLVVRTYRETISDALEAGFSFEGLDLDNYRAAKGPAAEATSEDALRAAIELQGRAADFYEDVAARSRSLLATISMAFKSAAKRKRRSEHQLAARLA
jgi:hypothetical protein